MVQEHGGYLGAVPERGKLSKTGSAWLAHRLISPYRLDQRSTTKPAISASPSRNKSPSTLFGLQINHPPKAVTRCHHEDPGDQGVAAVSEALHGSPSWLRPPGIK